MVAQGEIWWLESPHQKGRPVLVVSRNTAIAVMRRVLVAPITTTLRSTPSQLPLGREEGLPVDSMANFDSLTSVTKAYLVRRMGDLGPRRPALCSTLRAMADC